MPLASNKPPKSTLNKQDLPENFLVTADGPLQGTLACFQMLSNILNVPFRRDSITNVGFLKSSFTNPLIFDTARLGNLRSC